LSVLSAVGAEDQSLGAEVNFDFVAFFELALQYLLGQRVLHLALYGTLQGTGTERGVEARLGQPLLGSIGQDHGYLAVGEPFLHLFYLQVNDLPYLLLKVSSKYLPSVFLWGLPFSASGASLLTQV